ncbi:MAG: NAD(P)H-dependent flavin oxidoreductase [Acidimicrobiales bacterium]
MSVVLDNLRVPIVLAPMAGGPSTPPLASAVARAGGFGFLAAGYLTPEHLAMDIAALRGDVDAFGVNLFVGGPHTGVESAVSAYAARISAEADAAGIELGTPRSDDDAFDDKVALLESDPVAVVSFTFGIPPSEVVGRLRAVGIEIWVTVTSPEEALAGLAAGADVLVLQGIEAGGHRAVFVDDATQSDLSVLALIELVRGVTDRPVVAAGGMMTGAGVAAVLVAGAQAAQLGTAFLCTPEAGTTAVQRQATAGDGPTVLTRAFSGRTARAINNRFALQYGDGAPSAYPEVHHLTSPLRAHGRQVGDADLVNLWAGQGHRLVRTEGAGELTTALWEEAVHAMTSASSRIA